MSEFYVEKRRVKATLTMLSGESVRGNFSLAYTAPTHLGPERVGDLLNAHAGFFPFHVDASGDAPPRFVLYNRAHVLLVQLAEPELEAELDPSYTIARRKSVSMLLANGERLSGELRVILPYEQARLSDYLRSKDLFHYLELPTGTLILNFTHVIELTPISE